MTVYYLPHLIIRALTSWSIINCSHFDSRLCLLSTLAGCRFQIKLLNWGNCLAGGLSNSRCPSLPDWLTEMWHVCSARFPPHDWPCLLSPSLPVSGRADCSAATLWKIMVSRHTQRQNLQSWWARRGNDYRVWRLALIWRDYLNTNLLVCPHLDYHLRHHPPLITNTGDINSCLQTTIAPVISSFTLDWTETLRDSGRQSKTFNELLSSLIRSDHLCCLFNKVG